MREHPRYPNCTTPLANELRALFDAIPDESLLASLKTYYASRRGYIHRVSWRTYLAMTYLRIPSFAEITGASRPRARPHYFDCVL